MTFGEQNSLPQSFQLLDKAFDSGINFFDSAEMYSYWNRSIRCFDFFCYAAVSIVNFVVGVGIPCRSALKPKAGVRSISDVGSGRAISPEIAWRLLQRFHWLSVALILNSLLTCMIFCWFVCVVPILTQIFVTVACWNYFLF